MRSWLRLVMVAPCIATALCVTETVAQEVAKGREIYQSTCLPCHGEHAQGRKDLFTPALRLQQDWYLIAQLQKFRDRARGAHPDDSTGRPMQMIASTLDDDSMRDVAAYIAALGSRLLPSPQPTLTGNLENGKARFVTCIGCHGPEGRGNPALRAPDLTGQWDWYVARQIEKFKTGIRGADPRDVFGQQMRPFAAMLTDEQSIQDIATYIGSLAPPGPGYQPTVPDKEKGKSLYVTCVPCHGDQGQGNPALEAPALAGQGQWYLIRQLQNFQKGTRGTEAGDATGAQMRAAVANLDEDSLLHLAAHLVSLPATQPLPGGAEVEGDVARGSKLYRTCAACHGKEGQGNRVLSAPGISGLHGRYVVRQLLNFRAGLRGTNMLDPPGRVMRAWAASLPDEQAVRDMAVYLAALAPRRANDPPADKGTK